MRNFLVIALIIFVSGCGTVGGSGADSLTVGKVQREVRVGMSGAEVAEVLGSPNIVSTDADRNEVWIYDKISSHVVQSDNRGGTVSLRFLTDIGPIVASSRGQSKRTSQRTLTVLIKFDEQDLVRDFAYHTSRF